MQSDTACFQAALEAKRAELLAHAHKLEAIRIEQAADQLDHLQLLQDRELAIHQLDRDSSVLRRVEAALVRIRSGEFGICLGCDQSIPARRLQIVPWATYCVSCQEQVDRPAKEHIRDSHFMTSQE